MVGKSVEGSRSEIAAEVGADRRKPCPRTLTLPASPSDGSQSGSDDQAEELTISFAITPEEERLLLLDEVEDTQVTSLLQKLLSGETFGVEDFPGGDTSFCPKVDSAHGADQCGEENPVPNPHNGMQAFLAAQYEKISTQIKEMERNIRRDLGLPERIISNSRKRKAGDDNHAAETGQLQLRDRVEKYPPKVAAATLDRLPRQSGKRRKRLRSASVVKLIRIRCAAGGGDRTAAVETGLKSIRQRSRCSNFGPSTPSGTLHTDEEPTDHALTPPTCRNLIDQQPQRPSTALILYRDPLCVQPQPYVLPPEVPLSSVMAGGRSPLAWEKTNPHRYSTAREESVKERTIEPLEDPTHKERLFPAPAPRSERSGIVGGSSYGGFLVGVHPNPKLIAFACVKRLFPAPAPRSERAQDQLSEPEEYSKFGAGTAAKRSRKLTGVTLQINTVTCRQSVLSTWLSLEMVDRRGGETSSQGRIVIFDQYFTKTILSYWSEFEAANDKLKFEWGQTYQSRRSIPRPTDPAAADILEKYAGFCSYRERWDAMLLMDTLRVFITTKAGDLAAAFRPPRMRPGVGPRPSSVSFYLAGSIHLSLLDQSRFGMMRLL
ncbi:hypothetical protein Bca52824_011182 [Brassica carinata]|uniref:Uncharacterized protein n=1 Tax=Brassica carinata TaxID=52824 RepID=A0A8X7WD08_BRACI|nr:hypothetical protein Bca52824_011182 [Brassica carinata]